MGKDAGVIMKHAATQSLFAYWNELRASRAAPERTDIDPAQIRGVLADTFLLEIVERGEKQAQDVLVRLSGSRVNAIFNADIRERPFFTLWADADRRDIETMVATVLDDRNAIVAGVTVGPADYVPVSAELLLLPLRHHGKTHERMLGALTPASVPSWLGLVGSERLRLRSWRVVDSNGPVPEPGNFVKTSALRSPVDLVRRPDTVRRGHFVVYQGGLEQESHWPPRK